MQVKLNNQPDSPTANEKIMERHKLQMNHILIQQNSVITMGLGNEDFDRYNHFIDRFMVKFIAIAVAETS
ncbi:hypothetical protein T4B_3895 [Trichinella pseudospiralis]|uniref:Uncharacterized protein n=1 Tax=Trichinella pseudospiralis TaxID=6337 RepID=A0A0V1JKQ1_TRIPS|nr:hypothetical protein T4A_3227 [Trichinella pseudospiralis]KRZ23193.1 hypothetical protein T4B_3895 [Trichinella pseudospiralis]KRZ35553.1 hypothetical protein T4C_13179 [Trichinella pseudospiralis]